MNFHYQVNHFNYTIHSLVIEKFFSFTYYLKCFSNFYRYFFLKFIGFFVTSSKIRLNSRLKSKSINLIELVYLEQSFLVLSNIFRAKKSISSFSLKKHQWISRGFHVRGFFLLNFLILFFLITIPLHFPSLFDDLRSSRLYFKSYSFYCNTDFDSSKSVYTFGYNKVNTFFNTYYYSDYFNYYYTRPRSGMNFIFYSSYNNPYYFKFLLSLLEGYFV